MGDVAIDALRAGRAFLKDRSLADSGKLCHTGCSQGGHSAMATQCVMEGRHAGELRITATAPMAGFHALTATFIDALDSLPDLDSVLFAFGLTGLQKNRRDVYSTPSAAPQAPLAATIESLLPGTLALLPLLQQVLVPPTITGPGGLSTDSFANTLKTDATAGVRSRLAQNDLIDWMPRAPPAYMPQRSAAVCTGASQSASMPGSAALTVIEQPAISSDVTYEPVR